MLKSILAGLSIGLGGTLFTLTRWATNALNSYFETDDWSQPGQIFGSCVFSVGLMLVCWFKLSLFTGKVGLMFELNQDVMYAVSLLIMLIFNIGGAVAVGLFVRWIFGRFEGFTSAVLAIASIKTTYTDSNNYLKSCMNGLFCGVCVHLAVRGFANCEAGFEKFVILLWFVLMFVYSGFEHCIANTFYFACAHMVKKEVFINICLSICGNWLGTLPTSILTRKLFDRKETPHAHYTDSSSSGNKRSQVVL